LVETGGNRLPICSFGGLPGSSGGRARRHFCVYVIHQLAKGHVEAVARVWEGDLDFRRDASRVRGKEQDAVAHEDRFLDIVSDQQHRFDGQPAFRPEIEKIGADCLGCQHVKGRKGLVQQQNGRLDDKRTSKAHALAHAARQFARVGRLETVEADEVDRRERAPPAFLGGHIKGLESRLDILQNRQPWKKREGLEHHRDPFCGAVDRTTAIDHLAAAGPDETGDDAQQGRFARAGSAEQTDDLAGSQ
jgi:hypothetical protein